MSEREFRRNPFISKNGSVTSFSLRTSAIIMVGEKYLMVLNKGANKYKHPGGHLNINESLQEGLKRELKEEIGLDVNIEDVDLDKTFFDSVLRKDGNLMINSLSHIKIDLNVAENITKSSPLPTKILSLDELNENNTWKSEIDAIEYFIKNKF